VTVPATPDQIKHLEFIQAVIGRLATDSFLMKGWALTISAAIYGFAAQDLNWRISLIGLLPVLSFWFLDAYFLRQERLFRCLYAKVCNKPQTTFSMDTRNHKAKVPWVRTMFSLTLAVFYGALLAVGIGLTIVSAIHDPSPGTDPKDASASLTDARAVSSSPRAQSVFGGQISPT
jgi:hypothetical protein